MGELINQKNVIGLSFHVDYWDYIGWKDPFASPDYTARQNRYGRLLGQRYVYTPEMVVQGESHAVGSKKSDVARRIRAAASHPRIPVGLTVDGLQAKITLPAAAAGPVETATVWLAVYDAVHDTPVRRGENSGRQLRNFHVVRALSRAGTWRGVGARLDVDLGAVTAHRGDGVVVMVQAKTGRILGAAQAMTPH